MAQRLSADNISLINELWELHYYDPEPETRKCLGFLVDERFISWDDIEWRLGLSFGHNPFTKEMEYGFIPPPILPGAYIFGLHLVATQIGQLTTYDMWMDAFEGGDDGDIGDALTRGDRLLERIDETEFQSYVLDKPHHGDRTIRTGLAVEPRVIEVEGLG